MKRLCKNLSPALCLWFATTQIQAVTVYWDSNGATPGAGTSGTAAWNTATFWSPDSTGSTAGTAAWAAGLDAVFSAGTDATGTWIVTPNAAVAANSITVEEGTIQTAGQVITVGAANGAAGITINSGAKLSLNSTTQIVPSSTPNLVLNGGTFENRIGANGSTFLNAGFKMVLAGSGGTLSCPGPGVTSFAFNYAPTVGISGSGGLTFLGNTIQFRPGTVTYSYTGPTTIAGIGGGTMEFKQNNGATPNILPVTTDLIINSGGVFNVGLADATVASLSGVGIVAYAAASKTLTVNGSTPANDTTFSGTIQNAFTTLGSAAGTLGRLTKLGTSSLTLAGVNSISGIVTVGGGTLTVNPGAMLCGSVADLTLFTGATLNLNNAAQTIENLSGTNGLINLGSGHILTSDPVASTTYSGTIAGAGGLTRTNTSATTRTLTLNGPNTYDGVTTVAKGIIAVGSPTALGSTLGNTVVGSAGGEVLFTGAGTTFTCSEPFSIAGAGSTDGGAIAIIASAAPTLGGTVTLTADATITISSSASGTFNAPTAFSGTSQTLTIAGGANASGVKAITGAIDLGTGGLTKLQGGTWILSGVNTYTGPTTVSAGRLNIINPGSLAAGSAVTVSSGATLGGNGTIHGPVTVDGTLSPGTSIGTLTLDLAPTLNNLLSMEIDKGAAPNADKLVINNSLTFAGTLTVNNTGAALTGGEVFDLFDAISFSGSFGTQNLPSLGTGLNWYTANLTVDGTIKVNRAPTAGADALSTAVNTTASITLNKLKVNDSDADGDPLTITDVSSTSAQGGSLSFISDTVNYTPFGNYVGPDSFTYTLDDAHGGTKIVTVNVTVGGGSGLGANSVYAATEGSDFVVRFAGIPGTDYTVEHSNTSTGPWSKLINKTAPADNSLGFGIGVFEIREDTSGTEAGFYRTVHPAY